MNFIIFFLELFVFAQKVYSHFFDFFFHFHLLKHCQTLSNILIKIIPKRFQNFFEKGVYLIALVCQLSSQTFDLLLIFFLDILGIVVLYRINQHFQTFWIVVFSTELVIFLHEFVNNRLQLNIMPPQILIFFIFFLFQVALYLN